MNQQSTPGAGPLASRTAPASRGVGWIADGFRHFRDDWLAWVLATLVLTAISLFLQVLVPVLGTIALHLLTPVFLGGLMQGLADSARGHRFAAGDLFRAFSGPHLGQLVLVGFVWLLLHLVALVAAGTVFVMFAGAGFLTSLAQSESMLAAAVALTSAIGLLLALLVYVALLLPIAMLAWFAPALVVLEGEGAFSAMRHSFVGCLRNFLPFLVYGLVGLLLFPLLLALTLGLGFVVLVPVGLASIHSAYKDIFHRDGNLP